MSRPRDTITGEEVTQAQAVIDAWTAEMAQTAHLNLPYLRGLITAALAERYADGYTDGQHDVAEGGPTL